uniref:Major facilitator superfamily (MFS) profile domain-containing protein n=1 Tax=Panagrolaimus sp. ES5 TaxID=591445 RepID=A0AC34FFR3_9BILA
MYFPSKYLIAAIIIHGCIGYFEDLIQLIFIKAPVPLGHFYNDSLILHYGYILDNDGLSQVMALISNLQIFGSVVSLLVILPKMDSFGRKFVAIYFRAGLGFLAAILMLFGKFFTSFELFAVGAVILGATGPIRFGVTKYYISECSPDEIRGFITQSLTSVGGIICMIFTVLLLPQFLGNDEYWHFTLYISLGIIVIFVGGAVFIPESPKFLWLQGKKSEAIKAVKAFHGKYSDISSITFGYDHERSTTNPKSNHTSLREIWANDALRNSLLLVFAAALVATFGPLHIYALYSITLKIKYGFTNSQAVTFELFLNLACLPLGYILPFLYEKIGRRPMFLASVALSLLTAIFMFLAEAVFELNDSASNWITFLLGILFTISIILSISL